jgi:maleate cis-trans isomerase
MPTASHAMQQVAHVSVIERIEKSGKPVVTNTQAWTWEALPG